MTPPIDRERLTTLRRLASEIVAANCFPSFLGTVSTSGDAWVSQQSRAIMVLIAAEEMGVGLIDALNRARFDEHGLSFAPDPSKVETRTDSAGYTSPVSPAPAVKAAVAATNKVYDGAMLIPAGYLAPSKPMGDASIGELAVFYEEARDKAAHLDERLVAWKILGERIPSQTAFELGKLTRWILNKAHQPLRRETFKDVLTIAEARIESLGGAG